MSYGDYKERQSSFLFREKHFSEGKFNSNSSSVSPQVIVFPYVGPTGCGPGLLGNRPGVGGTEYLIALEHHASSLKSALEVVAALKTHVDGSSCTEADIMEDKESEHKKSGRKSQTCALEKHGSCVYNSSPTNGYKTHDLTDSNAVDSLSSLSLPELSNTSSATYDLIKLNVKPCTKCKFVKCSCGKSMIASNDQTQDEDPQQTDKIGTEISRIFADASIENCAKICASQHLVLCSSYGAGDNRSITNAIFRNDPQNDIEDSATTLKKKALRTARNALREFQRLMKEKEMSPQHKVIQGVLVCLTSMCKEEKLWRIHDDLLVSLEIPL